MTNIKTLLFDAFREDHAVLGRGLYELETALAGGDVALAKTLATDLDQSAGAHIAFEEADFYPALKAFLSSAEVEEMYADHSNGARLLSQIDAINAETPLSGADQERLLAAVREMEQHVSECGELFGALGGLNEQEMERLYQRLENWRVKSPRWSDIEGKDLASGEL